MPCLQGWIQNKEEIGKKTAEMKIEQKQTKETKRGKTLRFLRLLLWTLPEK
jgi:hypothetical protein